MDQSTFDADADAADAKLEAIKAAVDARKAEWDAVFAEAEDPAACAAKMRELPVSKCCLCGEAFKGHGHSARPVRNEGVACDECNASIVVPQRLRKWCPRDA